MGRVALALFFLFIAGKSQANSCCGQTPASYLVMYQHQKYTVSPSVSYTQSLGRVNSNDDFHVWEGDKKRVLQVLNINAAAAAGESGQFFLASGHVTSNFQEDGSSNSTRNFSDTLLGYSYEVVPEYTYSSWKPVVYLSVMVNVPTGHSIYDKNELSEGADVTGHNQWGAGLGITARKVFFPVTLLAQGKVLRLLAKDFSGTEVSGFYDSSLAGFVTYAFRWQDVSLSAGITWNHLSSRKITTLDSASGSSQVTTSILSLQKPLSDSWGLAFAVSDQTLIGEPRNTLLNRSYTLNFNYNYF